MKELFNKSMAQRECHQNYPYELDADFRPTKDKEVDELTKLKILEFLGIPKQTEEIVGTVDDESTDSSFADWSDHKIDVLVDPECGYPCEKDIGWFDIVQSSSPWDDSRRPYDPLLMYEDLELTDKEKEEGLLTGKIISTGLAMLDAVPMTDGFGLTKLELPDKKLRDVQILDSYKYLQYLDISYNHIKDLSPLESCTYLIVLDASHNEVEEFHPNPTPWFLTQLNLSFNKLKEVPDISSMWSLKHLNLSNNDIEKIEKIENLNYLEYVNLSYNKLSVIENISKVPLKTLDLSWNRITHCLDSEDESSGIKNISTLWRLDVSHNCISHMDHISCVNPSRLRHLNVAFNKFDTITSFDDLKRYTVLRYLRLEGNALINELPELVKHISHVLPQLDYINGSKLTRKERLVAYSMWSTNPIINEMKQYCYDLLYSNVEPPEYGEETPSHSDFNVPIVLLVGPNGTRKNELARHIANSFPEYVRVPAMHTTMYHYSNRQDMAMEFETMAVYHVEESEFNEMWNKGNFLFVHNNIGDLFGLSREELHNDGRLCLIPLTIGPALSLTWQGLNTSMILVQPIDDLDYSYLLQRYITSKVAIHKERDALKEIRKIEVETNDMSQQEEEEPEEEEDDEEYEEEKDTEDGLTGLGSMSAFSRKLSRHNKLHDSISSLRRMKRKLSRLSARSKASLSSITSASGGELLNDIKAPIKTPSLVLNEGGSIEYRMTDDVPLWCSDESESVSAEEEQVKIQLPFIDTLKTYQAERDQLWQMYNMYYEEKLPYYDEKNEHLFSQTVSINELDQAMKKILPILVNKYNASLKRTEERSDDPLDEILLKPRLDEMMEILRDRPISERLCVQPDSEPSEPGSSEPTKDTLTAPFFTRSTSSFEVTPSTTTTEIGSKEIPLEEPYHYWEQIDASDVQSRSSSDLVSMAKESAEKEGFAHDAKEKVIKYYTLEKK